MEKELIEFLKYVKEVHVDGYGHLEICDSGDELDPTVEKVVKDYLKSKEIQSGGGIGQTLHRQSTTTVINPLATVNKNSSVVEVDIQVQILS